MDINARADLKAIIVEALKVEVGDPWDIAVKSIEAQGLRRAIWATLSTGQKLKLIADAIESAKFARHERMMDQEPDNRTDAEINQAVAAHVGMALDYCEGIAARAWLEAHIESLGYWWQMRSPFGPEPSDGYWAGITPHETSGWNGTPDHWTSDAKPGRALARSFLRLMEEKKRFVD